MRPILFVWKVTTTVRSQWTVCLSQSGQLGPRTRPPVNDKPKVLDVPQSTTPELESPKTQLWEPSWCPEILTRWLETTKQIILDCLIVRCLRAQPENCPSVGLLGLQNHDAQLAKIIARAGQLSAGAFQPPTSWPRTVKQFTKPWLWRHLQNSEHHGIGQLGQP
jgi:hypothetical protein